VIGGAYGRGVVYQGGRPVGFTELNQGSVGATIGAQTYSELIVFHNDAALDRLKSGNIDVGAEASAVALKAGAAAAKRSEGGISVFEMPRGGLMATAAVTGQKINFQQMDNSFSDDQAVTASGRMRGSNAGTVRTGTTGNEASAYSVDRNLHPSDQVQLDTGHEAMRDASEAHPAGQRMSPANSQPSNQRGQ
jgi:lipid-binding SYLF domain-containing protein